MATTIRPKLSEKNKYWIDKHRHYELKHFCLQYPMWKKAYSEHAENSVSVSSIDRLPSGNLPGNPTAACASVLSHYSDKIKIIENAAIEADSALCDYILKAVTEGLSYTYLKSRLQMPCGKDMYYDRYRRFFWILNKYRK